MTFKEYIKEYPVDLNIKVLNLCYKKLEDIDGIEVFTKLEDINLYKNKIEDLTPLSKLVNLVALDMDDNNINNLDVILKLDKLTQLSIYRCYNLSNDYYKYVKMYWVEDNDLMDLKKIITMEKRKRIIAEL